MNEILHKKDLNLTEGEIQCKRQTHAAGGRRKSGIEEGRGIFLWCGANPGNKEAE